MEPVFYRKPEITQMYRGSQIRSFSKWCGVLLWFTMVQLRNQFLFKKWNFWRKWIFREKWISEKKVFWVKIDISKTVLQFWSLFLTEITHFWIRNSHFAWNIHFFKNTLLSEYWREDLYADCQFDIVSSREKKCIVRLVTCVVTVDSDNWFLNFYFDTHYGISP